MSIDILNMRRSHKSQDNDRALYAALPVWAVECEASPPLDNHLDAYEEAVLKLLSIRQAVRSIAATLNTSESLTEEVLDSLQQKKYAEKVAGQPWELTNAGLEYLNGSVKERSSDDSQFGYMFVNAIKKEVLPFFYQGDINQIPWYDGFPLPARLTTGGDEDKTFELVSLKRTRLKEAYRRYMKIADAVGQYQEDEITLEEAVDLFESLDSFDEEEETATLEDVVQAKLWKLQDNMFIRALERPHKPVYLTMRIILDPQCPGGYRAESPFDLNGIDNGYFLRQIQWFSAGGNTYLGGEALNVYLNREIRKISPAYGASEKDFSVFMLEKMPLLQINRERFLRVYDDMGRIYDLMRRQNSLIEKENIVNNMARSVLESLFNTFFRSIGEDMLLNISKNAQSDLKQYGCKEYIRQITRNTGLDAGQITWSHDYVAGAIKRLPRTHGNSIVEKFINVTAVNYYLRAEGPAHFLSGGAAQQMYELTEHLNRIRLKVSHDTDHRFDAKDYEFYMAHVFELVNSLLEAHREE